MDSATPTRERMVRTMARLIQEQGYSGTGLNRVLADSAAPRGSLYFHFPGGKRQLATEAVDFGTAATERAIERILAAHDEPRTAIDELVTFFGNRLRDSAWVWGCGLATVALELTEQDTELAARCDAGFQRWIDRLADHLAVGGIKDPKSKARFVFAAIEGALVLCRAARDLAPLDDVRQALPAVLDL